MAQVVPYINFADQGREILAFWQDVFGGEADINLVKDSPMAAQLPAEWGERIMHADFKAGDIHLLGSDIVSDEAGLERGNGYTLTINCDSAEQLRNYHAKLVDGGTEVFAPADSEWGSIFAQCTDKFGVQWMLDFQKPVTV